MKILITTLIWKREDLFKVWKEQIKRLSKVCEVIVLVAGSEGQKSWNLCKEYNYIDVPNWPIGLKAQIRARYMRYLDFDYCLFLGSDDFLSTDTFIQYIE